MGFIAVHTSISSQGVVNISGFHVDPGFRGPVIFTIFNAGPKAVILHHMDPIFTIMFCKIPADDRIRRSFGR
jgi:dCTP deaminase